MSYDEFFILFVTRTLFTYFKYLKLNHCLLKAHQNFWPVVFCKNNVALLVLSDQNSSFHHKTGVWLSAYILSVFLKLEIILTLIYYEVWFSPRKMVHI